MTTLITGGTGLIGSRTAERSPGPGAGKCWSRWLQPPYARRTRSHTSGQKARGERGAKAGDIAGGCRSSELVEAVPDRSRCPKDE